MKAEVDTKRARSCRKEMVRRGCRVSQDALGTLKKYVIAQAGSVGFIILYQADHE